MADGDDKLEIQGAGGGKGGGGRKPVEAPDTLHSIASAQVVDLVSEGPIVGFATENPLESVYLDETPLANPDGSLNFKDVQLEYRYGTQDQEYIKGFPFVENEIMAGVQLRHDVPFTRSITNNELSAIRVRIAVQGLSKVDEETNDLIGHSIQYAIDLAVGLGGTYKNVLTTAITGKTTSTYARSHRIDLPPSTSGWMLRVRRLTPNADSATVQDTTVIEATTEIIDAKLRYPNSALVATKVNAEQFPTIPRRAFDLVGRIVRVPSNYDPIARTYDGIWDGTFKPEWTDNPAWIYYDAVLHDRYGLGHRIKSYQIDQWALYRIARICDELVPDGKGGLEPRYTCNVFIQEQVEAYRLLRDLASVFNGIAYYADNRIVAGIDAPTDPAVEYTNADVIDGRFTYNGSGKSTRATVALVTWYDPDDFYRPKIEPVVDDAGVARYGIEQIELIATGCTSQGQAQRAGWWALLTGRLETEAVTFSLGLNGTFAMPGQVIRIADQHRAGHRIGGRISDATQNSVTVDKLPEVSPAVGDRVSAMLPNGLVEKRQIVSVEGRKLTTVAFSSVPVKGGAWIIETDTLHPTTWRVVSVTEASGSGDGSDGMTFNISAVKHAPEKFDAIDGGVLIEGPPTTQLPSTVQPAPAYVSLSAVERAGHVVASPMLAIEWPQTAGAVRYGVTYRREDGDWNELPTTTATRVEIDNVFKGTYIAQVWAYNAAGVTSGRTTSEPFVLGDQTMLPGVIVEQGDRIDQTVQELIDQQAAIDQEVADRIAEDLRIAGEAAADATAKANAALATAMAAVNALEAQMADIVGAPDWDPLETYEPGQMVKFDGGLYRALVQTTGDQPDTSPNEWEKVGDYDSLGEAVAAALTLATQTASELEAEVTRINALYARMPAGTDGLATEAMVLAEAQALANDISAEANRIDALVARMPSGSGTLATQASVSSEAATRAAADQALAERIDVTQARLGSMEGAVNPSFERDDGWGAAQPDVEFFPYSGARSGSRVLAFRPSSTSDRSQVNEGRLDVSEGQTIRAGAWVRWGGNNQPSSSAVASIVVRGYDKDGGYISGSTITLDSINGSQLGTSYQLIEGSATVPANWFYAALQLRVQNYSGPENGLIAFDDAFLEVDARGVRAVATALSMTQAEVSDHGDTLAAHTLQLDAHTAEIADKADTSYVNSVEGIATAAGDQASANQTAITGLTATVGNQSASISELMEVSADSRVGVVLNPSFERGPVEQAQADGWGSLAPNVYVFAYANARTGGRVLRFDASSTADRNVINNGRTTVTAGQQVRAGYWARIGGSGALNAEATVSVLMRGYDTSGAYVGGSAVTLVSLPGSSFSSNYRQLTGVYTVPANVVSVAVQIRVQNQTAGSLMVDDVFVEPIGADVATLRARHTVALDVNGHVSGTVNENDGETGTFSILAQVFQLIASGSVGMEIRHPRTNTYYMRFYAAGAQAIIGINFGASQNLVGWFGPNIGEAACTTSNSTVHATNTGDAYFGGTLTSGILTNSAESSQIGTSAIADTGEFGTNGNPKVVTFGLAYMMTNTVSGNAGSGTEPWGAATIILERSYQGGAWQQVSSRSMTGTVTRNYTGSDVNTTIITYGISGGGTYTDNTSGTGNFAYRARITSATGWPHGFGTITQRLNVRSVEE